MNDTESSMNMENEENAPDTTPENHTAPSPTLKLTPPSANAPALKLTPSPAGNTSTLQITSVPPPPPMMVKKPLPPPVQTIAEPLLTNVQTAADKPPLVFSDKNPLPQRDNAISEKKTSTASACSRPMKKVHLDRKKFNADASYGDLLRAAREMGGLSVDQVAQITKLRSYYIHAMENAQTDRLPPAVYVAAYIRSLCALYKLDDESVEYVQEKRGSQPQEKSDVPQTLIQSLEKDSLVNEEENRKIRKFFYVSAAVLLVLSAFIVWAIVAAVRAASEKPGLEPDTTKLVEPADKPVLRMEDFDSLTAPQYPEASALEMSKTPAVSR